LKRLKRLKRLKGRVGELGKGGKEGCTTQDTRRREEVVFIRIHSWESLPRYSVGLGVG
jgi:hypothetical protein